MGWTDEPPTGRGQTRDRWESWQALVDQAEELRGRGRGLEPDLAGFVDELDRRAAEQHAPVADGVTLATFHAAKGLEWDTVFLCGLQDGTLPITYADTPAAVEEERRLLYVGDDARPAATSRRLLGAGPQPGRTGLAPAVALPRPRCCPTQPAGPTAVEQAPWRPDLPRPAVVRSRARRRRSAARCLDCPAAYDEALFEALRDLAQGARPRGGRAGIRGVQ